jgi:hypothetical protein
MNDSLAALANLDRYPLLDDMGFAEVAAHCRQQLKESSFASLPGFLNAGIAEQMTGEVLAALPRAYRRERAFSAYENASPDEYPPQHVRQRQHWSRQFVVSNDILPKDGMLVSLYRNETLTRRIAELLDEPKFFTLADPVLSCTSTVMYEGDTHGWHFDLNDFVVSILLQAPESGGTFDFVPNIRDKGRENYHAVADAMENRSADLRSIKVEAGTLLLFCGRRALHRVPPVGGAKPRVIALFSYDRKPDVRYSPDVYTRVIGRQTVFDS